MLEMDFEKTIQVFEKEMEKVGVKKKGKHWTAYIVEYFTILYKLMCILFDNKMKWKEKKDKIADWAYKMYKKYIAKRLPRLIRIVISFIFKHLIGIILEFIKNIFKMDTIKQTAVRADYRILYLSAVRKDV